MTYSVESLCINVEKFIASIVEKLIVSCGETAQTLVLERLSDQQE